jgi:hypothetical protein
MMAKNLLMDIGSSSQYTISKPFCTPRRSETSDVRKGTLMPSHGKMLQFAAIAAAGILLTATALRPQAPGGGPGWQYCSVQADSAIHPGQATICYASVSGCRNEDGSGATPRSRGGIDAGMTAAAKLGSQGWELIAATENSQTGERTMYFKRLKALDNQHPLGN